ncbi:lysophospholipid acyltransferase family protein [Undibacterium flavidum]|uniref:1-acyl-sn-glycerol-3-phosphate acyltransferase n=1 Tax=Undibacterium flavidum TaxID=2762297 RepID=A0ABR6YC51_9BURK|nr:lysophospholipid acyltransferase family protein [Undibacterium flavidum]MBC3874118.1 1-acyl-sn-glycerol-3-phosphate acyltransferase [Undibacterium flavidum]
MLPLKVLQLLGRTWRLLATGFSFSAFGLGGMLLWLLVFPCLHMLIWQRTRRIHFARAIIRYSFRSFIGLMNFLGVLRYQIIGEKKLARQGLLLLANHPSLIDTVFLMAFVKNADCIVKNGLWNNPFTRGPVRAAAYINNEQGTELLDACINSLKEGNNLIIFPEGTRTPANGNIQLKRGAANIAIRGLQNLTPIIIHCEPKTLGKGVPWWKIPERQVQFIIEVKDDILIQSFTTTGDSEVMAARHLTEFLQHYFIQEKAHHA